jgi:GT2 family glycosyltransferase
MIGIVTRNRLAKLTETLHECLSRGFGRIAVLDNASTDGTGACLRNFPGIDVLSLENNIGGAGGFSELMRYFVEKSDCGWLLLFDDDAHPAFESAQLDAFLASQAGHESAAYALRVVRPEGGLCPMNIPGRNILLRHPLRLGRYHLAGHEPDCDVDFSSFVGLLLSRETIRNVGLVSPKFFLYSDDTYYTLSISRKLGPLRYHPGLPLVHDCARSSPRLPWHSPERVRRSIINKIVVIREYSRYPVSYCLLYCLRLLLANPCMAPQVLRGVLCGLRENCAEYRNLPLPDLPSR